MAYFSNLIDLTGRAFSHHHHLKKSPSSKSPWSQPEKSRVDFSIPYTPEVKHGSPENQPLEVWRFRTWKPIILQVNHVKLWGWVLFF